MNRYELIGDTYRTLGQVQATKLLCLCAIAEADPVDAYHRGVSEGLVSSTGAVRSDLLLLRLLTGRRWRRTVTCSLKRAMSLSGYAMEEDKGYWRLLDMDVLTGEYAFMHTLHPQYFCYSIS